MVDVHGRFCFLFFLFVVLAKSDGLVSLRRFVPDPLPMEPFNVTSTTPRLSVCFWNLQLHGLETTLLQGVAANLTGQRLIVYTVTGVVSLQGEYKLDGGSALLPFLSVRGEGRFRMNAFMVFANANATFKKGPDGRLRVHYLNVKLLPVDIKFHMDNLMGGGSLARVGNSMLNKIKGTIYKRAEESLHTTVRDNIRQRANHELSKISVGRSQSLVDGLIALIGEQLSTKGADPLDIPIQDYKPSEYVRVLLVNGKLHGLSTVRRSGVLLVYYTHRKVIIVADIEFRKLTVDGMLRWRILGTESSALAWLTINSLALHLELIIPVGDNATVAGPLHLKELEFVDVDQVWFNLRGGNRPLDYLWEVVANYWYLEYSKRELATIALKHVKDAVRRELATLSLSEFV